MKKPKFTLKFAIIIGVVVILGAGGFYFWYRSYKLMPAQTAIQCEYWNGGGGAIISISGSDIIVRDSYSGSVTRIVTANNTNYYNPDLSTRIASSSIIKIGETISGLGQHCLMNGASATLYASSLWWVPTLQDISAPDGWYSHRIGVATIMFTKQAQLPNIPATEGYAYGEQINISAIPLDHAPKDWAAMNIGTASDWGMLNGYKTIKAEIGTEANDELIYAIFDPTHYTVYEFTLYPYPNATGTPVLDSLVQGFAKNL